MAQTIRVYTEEGIDNAIIRGLRAHGVDVLTAPEAEMLGKTDAEHLELATSQQRVLLTRNVDFIVLAKSKLDHAGILYALQERSIGLCIRRVLHLWNTITPAEMAGRVVYL